MRRKIEYINHVKLSGVIERFSRKESGSYFGRLIQKEFINNKQIQHFFEFYVEANKPNISNSLSNNILVLVEGKLTIFKFKNLHKVIINIKSLTVLEKKI